MFHFIFFTAKTEVPELSKRFSVWANVNGHNLSSHTNLLWNVVRLLPELRCSVPNNCSLGSLAKLAISERCICVWLDLKINVQRPISSLVYVFKCIAFLMKTTCIPFLLLDSKLSAAKCNLWLGAHVVFAQSYLPPYQNRLQYSRRDSLHKKFRTEDYYNN